MQQARQLGHQLCPAGRFLADLVVKALPAHLLLDEDFQDGLRRDPQVQVGVELAAQTLDVEQRLLQQHQLGLDLDVEAARRLEEAHQHDAQRDLAQRPVEHRLAAGAHGAFQLFGPRVGRHPAGFDMQLGHPAVVALEEGQEVLCQVALVMVGERADDAEVQRDVAIEVVRPVAHQDVARVHVGVEETIAEDLREEDLHPVTRELFQVDAGRAHAVELADGDALDPLHHQHVAAAVVPVHLRDAQQRGALEVALELIGVGRLAHQVQLVVQVVVELVDHFHGAQPPGVGRQAHGQRGAGAQQAQVVLDHVQHARAQHLHGHLGAVVQAGTVNLGDGGRGDGLAAELGKGLLQPHLQPALDLGYGLIGRERRNPVLQQGQFVGDVGRQQVAPGGQHLAELHEDRPQALEGHPQAHPARFADGAHPQPARHAQKPRRA